MTRHAWRVLAAVFAVGAECVRSAPAIALPMSYPGSTTVGAELDPHWSTLWLTKAVDRRHGLGFSANRLPAQRPHQRHAAGEDGAGSHARQGDEVFALVDATRLVQRWNLPKAQANLWLFVGVGGYQASGTSGAALNQHQHHQSGGENGTPFRTPPSLRLAARPGVQLDFETTRLRVEGRGLLYLAPGIQRPLLSATAGVALTRADYERVQPWVELQVRAMPGVVDKLELIPKLRLLHRRLVLDVGYSNRGSLVGGVTYTF